MADLHEKIRVEVELTSDHLEWIDQAVREGQFHSRADAVEHALVAWHSANSMMPFTDEELGRLWDEGIASGDPLPAEDVFQRLRERITERLNANEKKNPA